MSKKELLDSFLKSVSKKYVLDHISRKLGLMHVDAAASDNITLAIKINEVVALLELYRGETK
tara:strand:+ start:296 stop:481 length:186 start_codon:yes stop_codon:yes gene_type:complete